ncbi:hypothetical protein H632_c837p1 [Helicosporidium sp. ATCC 50920]|nr:hypothetical protein H632_c837p1 [Helicosporidium sp. ATCC 50920]|eukprot:KDD75158.1 hypothetical protein H632_c837p1 [Helicosporidium sp. ATCC 50920]
MGDPAKLSLEDLVRHTRGQVDRLKQSGEHNPALQELDKLIKASDEQVKRLEDWRHGKHPLNFFQRVRRHVGRHSRSLGDVAFAGVLLALAIERLSEKNTVKKERQRMNEEAEMLRLEHARMTSELEASVSDKALLVADMDAALAGSSWKLREGISEALLQHRQRGGGMSFASSGESGGGPDAAGAEKEGPSKEVAADEQGATSNSTAPRKSFMV